MITLLPLKIHKAVDDVDARVTGSTVLWTAQILVPTGFMLLSPLSTAPTTTTANLKTYYDY